VLCALVTAGCLGSRGAIGVEQRAKSRFESDWRRYLKLPSAKALAVAGDVEGVYVSGVAYAEPSDAAARAHAMERCQRRRLDRRIVAECRPYAVGDTTLSPGE
jgi:hypothetical protein